MTNSELDYFRQWVRSQSHEDLLRAMEFDLPEDEYQLLNEMVDLQSPPPTPIHPGVLGYRPATNLGATDGRNEEERIYKLRFRKPRLFQLHEKSLGTNHRSRRKTNSIRFDVIARKFVTPWGQVLSLGCTQEQQDADELALKGTRIRLNEKGANRCTFCCPDGRILRILQIASRGKFLSLSVPRSPCMPLCAPWMSAEVEWFSLPMYLSSRFEMALWTAFWQRDTTRTVWSDPIQGAIDKLPEQAFQNALLTATVTTLKRDVFPADSALVRDCVMWNLLDARSMQDLRCPKATRRCLENVSTVAIIDLESSKHMLQRFLWRHLQEAIAIEIERDILLSLDDEVPTVRAPSTKRKNKGKTKKRRKEASVSATKRDNDRERECMPSPRGAETKSALQFSVISRESIEETKEYSRKAIMAGSIIVDIVDDVFDQLGLNSEPPEGEDTTANDQKKDSMASKEGVSSCDEGEVPARNLVDGDMPILHENSNQQQLQYLSVPWIFDDPVDGWEKLRRHPNREKSLLADLFLSQKKSEHTIPFLASSTAASIASSSDKGSESGDTQSIATDSNETDEKPDVDDNASMAPATPIDPVLEETVLEAVAASLIEVVNNESLETFISNKTNPDLQSSDAVVQEIQRDMVEDEEEGVEQKETINDCRSPSPTAPETPPPQLSPIFVSLADLQTIRTRATSESAQSPEAPPSAAAIAGSLPSSPMPASTCVRLTPSLSRDDLRIHSFTDSHSLSHRQTGRSLHKQPDSLRLYRNAAANSLPKVKSSEDRKSSFAEVVAGEGRFCSKNELSVPHLWLNLSRTGSDNCAQSETAVEAHSYELPLNDVQKLSARVNTEVTISTKDDTRAKSPTLKCPSCEELVSLRDERNAFRDMCLTLGAEVSKLKNMLAAQSGSSPHVLQAVASKTAYGPEFSPPFFSGVSRAKTVGAMSDAGINRGDHDSAISEDGTDVGTHDNSGRPRSVHLHRISSGATNAGSDLSVEYNTSEQVIIGTGSFRSFSRDATGSIFGHGLHSRLTQDIMNFLSAKSLVLSQQEDRKTAAIQRMTRLVTTVWPRAQVKLYGSHATGLCLPSSDLDFVICLPAVHKNAPAVTPGVLEGRNAINESSQKFLARKLKGESWIDPRSIKIIHAIVPIIKVSTKDTRARMLQLDISFDGPEHHGLAVNEMIDEVMRELPMIQPLVLVLKQFLNDRGLLQAFTGGLSSYCLFLMVTRYLQEHPSSWGDCGSLLMGFLDFYGNSFDPRETGISVGRRQYFARPNYAQPQPMWNVAYQQHLASPTSSSVGGRPDLIRRNSFNDNATMDGPRGFPHSSRPPRFQSWSHHRFPHQYTPCTGQDALDHAGRPYTFDPLFVEDPLSIGNNVGRNAFRIFQVQRAFSDAHRALVASLEWDIHSSHDCGGEYPLLNCLLQSDDVFYELVDDAR